MSDNSPVEGILRDAIEKASSLNHEYVCLEHLTICLLNDSDYSDTVKNTTLM